VLKAFGRAAADVDGRLRYLMRTADKNRADLPHRRGQYAHVRKLVQHGRVYAVRGDYTADATLLGLADALTGAGLDLSVIYLSNIEQYFDYGPTYRRNMLALPVAKDAIVIRTLGWKTMGWVEKDTYHYNTQPAASFQRVAAHQHRRQPAGHAQAPHVDRQGRRLAHGRSAQAGQQAAEDRRPTDAVARRSPAAPAVCYQTRHYVGTLGAR
jgi:hypothetical protein